MGNAIVRFRDRPIGIKAAADATRPALNYDQIFVRDFSICAPAFLLRGETEIVRNFLEQTLELQSVEAQYDCFQPGKGLMPASFRPEFDQDGEVYIEPDYGEESIARVTPVDSVFLWLMTLRSYVRATGDEEFARSDRVQRGIRLILELCLAARFEMYPTLLAPDGSFMVDRRMGVHGHPLELQSLFFGALRAAHELLDGADGDFRSAIEKRLPFLAFHVRRYYWLDRQRLHTLASHENDQYGDEVANIFNIYSETIPDWLENWVPENTGYLAGNLGPQRLDYRFFTHGNLLATMTGLATEEQARRIIELMDQRWDDLAGKTPFKLCFPAYEGADWKLITGADPKNKPWSYHNGGSWPFLLSSFAIAGIRYGREDLVERAIRAAEQRVAKQGWPEYYEGRNGDAVGERARLGQTWTMGGLLNAIDFLEHPEQCELFCWPHDIERRAC